MGFEALLGNERLRENLSRSISRGHVSHFYLISGPVGAGKKTLVVLANNDEKVIKSFANIPGVKTTQANTINVYDILNCNSFVVVSDAAKKIEEVYA